MLYLKLLFMNMTKPNIGNGLCDMAERLIMAGANGIEAAQQLTLSVDELLVSAYKSAACYDDADMAPMLSLVAVGGYGRMELAPYSDIDIMLLAKSRAEDIMEAAQSVLYSFWDMGLNISHCFRTLNECVEDAMNDLQTRTSLIESRFLAGSEMLWGEFKQDIYQKLLFKNKKEFIGGILREIERRHKEYGDSVYLLEPNVKEGRGGLRDIHSVSWLLKAGLRVQDIEGLKKMLSPNEYSHFIKAYDFTLKTRLCLHFISKRKNDILSFDIQNETAKRLGFKDTKRFLSSEILLRLYYRKAKSIMDVLTRLMHMCGRKYVHLQGGINASGVKKVTDDFYISMNEIIVRDKDIFRNTDKILEAFYIYSFTGKKFSYQLRELLRSRFLFINKKTRSSKKAVMHFMDILKGNRVYETLREMHDTGILDRFIPEFGRLRHLVIHEPYHRYTVDEHTLIAVRNLEMLRYTKQKRLQYLADIFRNLKQEILFLAVLFHDIGKGANSQQIMIDDGAMLYTNKHEDTGYRLLKGIFERFNIGYEDRQTIEFLVRNHVVLSKLALTRDPDAPETITQLAELVENEENLNALYLITYADMTAVNPHFWTEWKAYLFHDIYIRTRDHLLGIKRHYMDISDNGIKRFVEDMPYRYLISNTIDTINADFKMASEKKDKRPIISIKEKADGTAEFTIITDDMPGLFSRIVGVLGFRGLNILRARLYTGKSGLVVDKILVSNWRDIWWQGMEERIKEDLKDAIGRSQDAIGEKIYNLSSITSTSCLSPFSKRFESFIEIDNETSGEYTILELLSPDRLGLLYDISSQFYAYGVDIIVAVINTEDRVANDVFYLQYKNGKLSAEIIMKILNSIYPVVL